MASFSQSTWFLVCLCLLNCHVVLRCAAKDCYETLSECNNDTKCFPKLNDYAMACGTIVDSQTTSRYNSSHWPCTKACVAAIKALIQTPKGKSLWKCDCNLEMHCLTLKARTEKCLAIANGTYKKRVGCTMALMRCMGDQKCQQAQDVFLNKCSELFSLTACTTECLCSQKRLFSLAKGRPLMDCECDGSDETYCLGLRAHAEEMKCNWKNRRARRRLKKLRKRCRQRKDDKQFSKRGTRKPKD